MRNELASNEITDPLAEALTNPPEMDPKIQRLREFVSLTALKRDLETRLKDAKARLDPLEAALIEQFQQDGIQSVNADGYTVYLNRKLFAGAKDGDKPTMIAALEACDETWSFLVEDNVNSQRLCARVRECELGDDGMPLLPDELKDAIQVCEQFTIGARKSN